MSVLTSLSVTGAEESIPSNDTPLHSSTNYANYKFLLIAADGITWLQVLGKYITGVSVTSVNCWIYSDS